MVDANSIYDICCVGHLTVDRVVTKRSTVYMAGGTSYYFSNAIQNLDVRYELVTKIADAEISIVNDLIAKGISVIVKQTPHTLYFENTYGENLDHRTQRVLQTAEPFSQGDLFGVSARIFHLGPLLAPDIPIDVIKLLAAKGDVSLDIQGYLRKVRSEHVMPIDWSEKYLALPYIRFLKANEQEMFIITGLTDVHAGAKKLADWGAKEIIITLGSLGSVVYCNETFVEIPSFVPGNVVDVTGCGDTYMAGYLFQRLKGKSIEESGRFAAAMATLKIETSGPFMGDVAQVTAVLNKNLIVH